MIRVRIFNVNSKEEHFGNISSMPIEGSYLFVDTQSGETVNLGLVIESYDFTSTGCKFMTARYKTFFNSYELDILSKDPQAVQNA